MYDSELASEQSFSQFPIWPVLTELQTASPGANGSVLLVGGVKLPSLY
jgi:hypothetical protein